MSNHVKVNFEITSINQNMAVAYVKYWADGATVERFGADIGPYEIYIHPDCVTMSDQEFYEYIARIGIPIVQRQQNALDSESVGAISRYETIIDTPISANVEIITANT